VLNSILGGGYVDGGGSGGATSGVGSGSSENITKDTFTHEHLF